MFPERDADLADPRDYLEMTEMQVADSSAKSLYQAAAQTARTASGQDEPSFSETMHNAAQSAIDTLQHSEKVSEDMIRGAADPHSVVEALAATELALETAVAIRNKVVEAYQEILRMPV